MINNYKYDNHKLRIQSQGFSFVFIYTEFPIILKKNHFYRLKIKTINSLSKIIGKISPFNPAPQTEEKLLFPGIFLDFLSLQNFATCETIYY